MDKTTAQRLVRETFKAAFDKKRYRDFINELCNGFDEGKAQNMGVPDAFTPHVKSCQRLGTFESADGELADVLIVHLTESYKLERTRTALRDFVAHKLKRDESYKEAGLVAFVAPDSQSWRFSFVRMEYETKRDPKSGKIKPEERLTPARRYSYIVGVDEECHTAQSRFLALLQDTSAKPTLSQLEEAFSVESVTKEFFAQYAALFAATQEALDAIVKKDAVLRADFAGKKVSTVDFAKKLLGQIVFLYFIQKKGWLGVAKGGNWGDGPRNFLRKLADGAIREKKCLFNDVLEPLFYDTLATDRGREAWCKTFACRIPFLNGGLFEPLAGYDWERTNISFSNSLFSNQERTPAGDTGSGILDVFDRYNFTVNEAEPLEKEVAIDPEMLGKVFENLIEENRRKGLGAFYTPREIVHYMCQESLINYLDNGLNHPAKPRAGQPIVVPRKDVEEWIRQSDQFAHYAAAIAAGTKGDHYPKPPDSIRKFAAEIDILLRDITVCDPAIGSGAFPVGMMTELVRARVALTPYFKDVAERTPYHFKRHAIQNSIYGVDIDIGAVEIAKLRLWLSLVVDEEDIQQIKPLPNLDYKVVVGNSLLGVERDIFNDSLFVQLEKLKPKFFNESNREKKTEIKTEIEALIHKLTNGKEVFDFQIYFSEVFHASGGFDIIVANPPYIDSEAMAKNSKALRDAVQAKYKFTKGNWDIYIAFFELAFDHLNRSGGVSFITPDKWVAKPFGNEMRRLTTTKLDSILRAGREIFENAKVDAIVTVYFAGGKDSIKVRNFDGRAISDTRTVHKTELVAPFFYDWMFSDRLSVLSKIEESGVRLDSIGTCENACATSDAYKLQSLVKNAPGEPDSAKYFKVINTGTIAKYVSRWGAREMVYLGDRYMRPVVNRTEFLAEFPNSYGKKAGKPKLIAKGLNLLDVCLDERGDYIPGKTTLIVTAGSVRSLKLLLAIMNHPIAMFYMKERYPAASYNQGTSFTKDMINSYPLPKMREADVVGLVSMVDEVLDQRSRQNSSDIIEGRIRSRIFDLYQLNEADIVKVEPAS
jgi:type I restriction-modification system DNA methylase subunit